MDLTDLIEIKLNKDQSTSATDTTHQQKALSISNLQTHKRRITTTPWRRSYGGLEGMSGPVFYEQKWTLRFCKPFPLLVVKYGLLIKLNSYL